MPLTASQHDELMRIINDRHLSAIRASNLRQEELEKRFPAVKKYNEEISGLSYKEAEARLRNKRELAAGLSEKRAQAIAGKRSFLADAGYPEDYEGVRWHCPKCRDTGYIGGEKCGCLKQLESELLNRLSGLPYLMEKENFSTFDFEVYDNTEYIEELKPKRITQYKYMKNSVLPDIERFLREFESEGSHNILMFGPAGAGKTFLCNCIARELIDRQHSVAYERAGEMFLRMAKAEFSKVRMPEEEGLIERTESAELLIIDDLGTEFSTEYTKGRLFSVISNRLSRALSTIITTNMSLSQLKAAYGERVSSRFIGEYMLLPFYGADLRVSKGKGV